MVNAIHAMSGGGQLSVLTQDCSLAGRNGVEIIVADTGAGIQAQEMQRIFDPFYTTKKGKGTGLGLSITQMLVARQGGTIGVESEPGRGTRFLIRLPAV
jgi:two-component system, NtrC family, sensor kinase